METTVKERLIEFIDYVGMNKNSFEKKCGFSTGFVSNMRVSMQPDKVMSIADNFPELDTGWLLTGEGNMIKARNSSTKISAKLEGVNTIPYYELTENIELGPGTGFGEVIKGEPTGYMMVPGLSRNEDVFFVKTHGRSMINPTNPEHQIPEGSWIAVQKVKSSFIQWGEVYLLSTVQEQVNRGVPLANISLANSDMASWEEFVRRRIGERTLRDSTRRQHIVALKSMMDFVRTFADLTVPKIMEWDNFLHRRGELSQSSIYGYHKRMKPYVKEAYMAERIKENPYDKIHIDRGASGEVEYLTESERDLIDELQLSGTIGQVKDMFIFSCYTGIAYADLVKITPQDIKSDERGRRYIEDKRQKTSTRYRITLLPRAMEILEKYGMELPKVSNQKCNTNLKVIADVANLGKHLTFHMARHTFATWALHKGLPIEVVSKMLAHRDIQTTQIYAKVLQKDVEEGFDKLAE